MSSEVNEELDKPETTPADAVRLKLEEAFKPDGNGSETPKGGTDEQGSHSPGSEDKPNEAKPEGEKPNPADATTEGAEKPKGPADNSNPESTLDLDNLPESSENWKKVREAQKKLKAEIEALKAAKKVPEADPVKPVAPAPVKPPPPVEDVFSLLHDVVSGKDTAKGFNEKNVRAYISKNYTRAELNAVKIKAMEGGFGESSQEIAAFVDEAMPYVEVQEQETLRARQSMEQFAQLRHVAVADVSARFPGIKDPESAEYKEFDAAALELQSQIPEFDRIPHGMKIVADFVELKRAAASIPVLKEQIEKANAEVNRLNGLIGKSTPVPHGATSTPTSGKPLAERLADEFAKT